MDNKFVFNVCMSHFQFLMTEYKFKLRKKSMKYLGLELAFQNDTTAVKISFEWREQYIFVSLCRLVDGKLVNNPIFIDSNSIINCYGVNTLLKIRAPELIPLIVRDMLSRTRLSGHSAR